MVNELLSLERLSKKIATNGLGLAEVVEIRALQPNPCTKDKLKN
jgi:hypothetical protein